MMQMLLAPNPSPMTLDGTRTFIVGRARPVVIDPGPNDPRHLDAIERALGGIAPVAILLTHAHPDHADAAPPLAARTGAPVWTGGDGDEVHTDAGPLRAIATPGHTPDHLAFLWNRQLFAGDVFMGGSDTTLVAPPEGDLAAYLRTLDRVGGLPIDIILPAHGPAITDPAAAVERYRAHRHERIAQVVAAIRASGSTRPAEILDAVYGPTLHPALRPAAEGSLRAILTYLRNETEAPR